MCVLIYENDEKTVSTIKAAIIKKQIVSLETYAAMVPRKLPQPTRLARWRV